MQYLLAITRVGNVPLIILNLAGKTLGNVQLGRNGSWQVFKRNPHTSLRMEDYNDIALEMLPGCSRLLSFSNRTEHLTEYRLCHQHVGELFDQGS